MRISLSVLRMMTVIWRTASKKNLGNIKKIWTSTSFLFKGFLIKNLPSVSVFGAIHPVDVDGVERKYFREFTQFAIDKNNSEKNDDLELVEITRFNLKYTCGIFCYITFDAIHSSKPEEKESYQTQVRYVSDPDPGEEKITVKVFREDRLAVQPS